MAVARAGRPKLVALLGSLALVASACAQPGGPGSPHGFEPDPAASFEPPGSAGAARSFEPAATGHQPPGAERTEVAAAGAGYGGLPAQTSPGPTQAPRSAGPTSPARLRVFVAAEYAGPRGATGEVWVLEGGQRFELVARIPAGAWPHNLAVSPQGRWIAVANRSGNSVSIIDPFGLKEVARVPVGRQPHDLVWHPDGKTLFVSNERDMFISRIEAESWRALPPIGVGAPQHTLAIAAHRPDELYFTLTFFGQTSWQPGHVRAYNLSSGRITRIAVEDAHDVFFTPDGSELWSSSSGFLEKPSDRIVIYDPETKAVKDVIRLTGRYPFHTIKENRDGIYRLPDRSVMVLSSHSGPNGPSLLFVDWKERRLIGEAGPLGRHVFHTTYDPIGGRLLATSNVDGMVNVIDVATRRVLDKIPVPKAHGIAAIGIP
jgi:YVTN family beta-propeller protein